jgi:hypothetical protein
MFELETTKNNKKKLLKISIFKVAAPLTANKTSNFKQPFLPFQTHKCTQL